MVFLASVCSLFFCRNKIESFMAKILLSWHNLTALLSFAIKVSIIRRIDRTRTVWKIVLHFTEVFLFLSNALVMRYDNYCCLGFFLGFVFRLFFLSHQVKLANYPQLPLLRLIVNVLNVFFFSRLVLSSDISHHVVSSLF